MKFDATDLAAALVEGLGSVDISILAKAQNVAWEECVSDPRRMFFENEAFANRGSTWTELADRQSDYIQLYVNTDGTPHTFEPSLQPAGLGSLDEDQMVVRLERLERALDNSIFSYDELLAAHQAGDRAALDRFAADWNNVRDSRPVFATFLREVQQEIASLEWAELLRNRLGLAHFQPIAGDIPVALMAYKVREILAEAATATAFTTPTVLDSTLWEHYFPAPRGIPYGRAMALTPCDSDDLLVAEILHSRLSYTGGHIYMLGNIATRLTVPSLSMLRERHLFALQLASGREDFGG